KAADGSSHAGGAWFDRIGGFAVPPCFGRYLWKAFVGSATYYAGSVPNSLFCRFTLLINILTGSRRSFLFWRRIIFGPISSAPVYFLRTCSILVPVQTLRSKAST
ncbi:hypothetical protein, partial [Roseibium polysiphoniae]|uniref:hypothetical protein n=1 Tax=Roseibium polysiphoniae TaxID=2571221 RepID=UPI003299640D